MEVCSLAGILHEAEFVHVALREDGGRTLIRSKINLIRYLNFSVS